LGNGKETKLAVLTILFLVTFALVHLNTSEAIRYQRAAQLSDLLSRIDGYEHSGNFIMEENISRFLDLDDYAFASFRGAYGLVHLYVGFYATPDKISAAHSPLACYPAQGWTITQPNPLHLIVDGHRIDFAEIIACRQEREELVRYWFQAKHATTPNGRRNKLNSLYHQILGQNGKHAFVRVVVPVNNVDYELAREAGTDFMKSFYPRLVEFFDQEDHGKPTLRAAEEKISFSVHSSFSAQQR
jgi:EpsI family protein